MGDNLEAAIAFANQYRISWMEVRGWGSKDAWEAYDYMPLERVKREAPIWKLERYADGSSRWREEEPHAAPT